MEAKMASQKEVQTTHGAAASVRAAEFKTLIEEQRVRLSQLESRVADVAYAKYIIGQNACRPILCKSGCRGTFGGGRADLFGIV